MNLSPEKIFSLEKHFISVQRSVCLIENILSLENIFEKFDIEESGPLLVFVCAENKLKKINFMMVHIK